MENKKLPEHLQGLEDEVKKIVSYGSDDKEYAEIAFLLLKAGDGDKEALHKIADYIKSQHQIINNKHTAIISIKDALHSWMMWAEIWTQRKEQEMGL